MLAVPHEVSSVMVLSGVGDRGSGLLSCVLPNLRHVRTSCYLGLMVSEVDD